MSLSERIKSARKNANLTQQALADLIGVAKSTVTGYEKGDREPDALKLKLIAKHTGVTGGYLLEIDDAAPQKHVLSPAALALASIYDSLDDHGKCMLDTVAKLESERMEEKPLPKGLVRMRDLPLYPIKYLGDALCDGTIETKYAAKQELRELRESSQVDPVPEHE